MRAITVHRCDRPHRSVNAWLHCAVPSLRSVGGAGRVGVILWCGPHRAYLFHSAEWARTVFLEFGVFGCGPECIGEHELILIPERAEVTA